MLRCRYVATESPKPLCDMHLQNRTLVNMVATYLNIHSQIVNIPARILNLLMCSRTWVGFASASVTVLSWPLSNEVWQIKKL